MAGFPLVNSGNKYARDVVAGRIEACKWVKLACQRHLDDLKKAAKKAYPYRFDKAKAEKKLRFVQHLPHTKGKWAAKRENLRLEPWQCFGLMCIFGWVRKKDGLRRFRRALILVPRKNGKSALAAAVGHAMFLTDGEFAPEVYCGATTERQAWEVFRPAKVMAQRTPELVEAFGIEVRAKTMVVESTGGRFEPVVGDPGDGSSPSCAIADEYHEHTDRRLVDTMETGMGAREQPLMFIITTAGADMAGPCYQDLLHLRKVLEGVLVDDELFGIEYTVDEADDWTSEAALRKANPNWGVSVNADFLQGAQRQAMQSATRQAAFQTKHLNLWVGARNAWMNMRAWDQAPARLSLEELAGRPCIIGLDLASKVDIAAMVALFPPLDDEPGGLFHVHGRYFLPESAAESGASANASHYAAWARQGLLTLTDGEVIDFGQIEDDLREFSSRFQVVEVPFDPWQATQMATRMMAEGVPMVELRATVQNYSAPMKELEALVLQKRLAHGHCPVLTWMASNVTAKVDAKDNIYPRKEADGNKIDGIVALITAMNRHLAGQGASQPMVMVL